jgi:serine/threonine protein kinase
VHTLDLDAFDFVKQIGTGGWGSVHEVTARLDLPFAKTGGRLAVKLYLPDLILRDQNRLRILREFKTGLQLRHQNLVRFHALELVVARPFLVMEFCDGDNLAKWRRSHGEPTEEFLLQFATQMLEVLDFLHASNRIHRDVKPSNINVDLDGKIRLLDYGLILDQNEPGITEGSSAHLLGTYRYAAPESIFKNAYSVGSDLYSLGATLYYLLYGAEVFAAAKTTPDVINAKRKHVVSFTRTFDGPVANAIQQLCHNLLEPEPDNRPASASECWEILARAIPTSIPFRVYFACALTMADEARRSYLTSAGTIVQRVGSELGYKVYVPGDHTDPVASPDLSPREVYWIDRERVASSDLIFILADAPSFGVGQEAEIAANAGVPLAIFHSPDVKVSKMLRGIAGRKIHEETFVDICDLEAKARRFFATSKDQLSLSRRSREREFHLRVGNRVRNLRMGSGTGIDDLARLAEVPEDLILALETKPEQQSNFSLLNLRRIARALDVPLAQLVADQSTRDARFGELYHESLLSLRKFAKREVLSYSAYERLKSEGKKQLHEVFYGLAKRGQESPLSEKQWEDMYLHQVQSRSGAESTGLFADNDQT